MAARSTGKAKKLKDQEDRLVCVHYDSDGQLRDEEGRKVDLQNQKYANKCVMLTGKPVAGTTPRKKKKRNYRDIEFDESIYEEALARKKRALLQKHMFTSKELVTLALLKSDSEESEDEDFPTSALYPPTSNHQHTRPLSPVSNASSSEISVTRLSPLPEGEQLMPQTEGILTRLELRMDSLEDKLDRIMELLENKGLENEKPQDPMLVPLATVIPSTSNKEPTVVPSAATGPLPTPRKVTKKSTGLKVASVCEGTSAGASETQQQPKSKRPNERVSIPQVETVNLNGHDSDYITKEGVNLLRVQGENPVKYAIALMNELFTEEEMARSIYIGTRRSSKPALPVDKRELMEDCIDKRFGDGTVQAYWEVIKQRCNQKCSNVCHKLKVKHNLAVYEFDDFN